MIFIYSFFQSMKSSTSMYVVRFGGSFTSFVASVRGDVSYFLSFTFEAKEIRHVCSQATSFVNKTLVSRVQLRPFISIVVVVVVFVLFVFTLFNFKSYENGSMNSGDLFSCRY